MFTCIATVVSTQGLNGELRVKENVDISEFFDKFDKVFLKSGSDYLGFEIQKFVKHSKKGYVLSLVDVSDITRSDFFVLRDLYVSSVIDLGDKEIDISEEEIEFFAYINGKKFILENVIENTHNDLLVLKDELGKELLVPNIEHFVSSINHETGCIDLINVEGLDDI